MSCLFVSKRPRLEQICLRLIIHVQNYALYFHGLQFANQQTTVWKAYLTRAVIRGCIERQQLSPLVRLPEKYGIAASTTYNV